LNDDHRHRTDKAAPPDSPLAELTNLRVTPHPDLEGRVRRDINRRNLAADSLDFSLNVMLQTFWEHLRSAIDAWPGSHGSESETRK